jgi:aminopeptidase N
MTDVIRLTEMGAHAGADFTMPGAEAHYPPDIELEPVHLDIALRLDIPRYTAEGIVTSTIRAARKGPSKIKLHAVDFHEVDVRDAAGGKLTWSYDGHQISASWDAPFNAGEERKLVVHYKVIKPVTGLFFSNPSKEYPNAGTWAATDHETERARHWLPCIDLPNVRPTLSFHLTSDSKHTILANGALVKEETHGDKKTAHWELRQRCPSYITCFAAGDFTRCDDGEHKGKPIAYFAERKWKPEDLKRTFGRTGAMLDWMTKKLDDPFPFPKYFQFALPGIGGAMENISLVSWDDSLMLDATLAKEWTWQLDQINLHEMAHSWFGDHIVCRDFAHAWLKESWAVYMETCYLEDASGRDEADYDFYANLHAYITEADEAYVRPIATRTFDHSWSMYDRHLYPGGAVRLHMLRKELGDETFWAGVRDYVKTYGGKVVETDDFRKVLEKHSGKSLVKWFDQWIFGKGYPKLKASFSYDEKKKEGTFEIEQTQASDKESPLPLFDFTTEIGWVIDGKLTTQHVRVDKDKQHFTVKLDKEPQQVRIDPLSRTVCKFEFNPGEDKLRAQLGADDVNGRIYAARELCKTGKRKNIEAVAAAYKVEKFWGARNRMAMALSEANCDAAVEALCELVGHEHDGMVCETTIRCCGHFRAPRVREALGRFIESDVNLYRARAAAWEMLGVQRDEMPLGKLLEAADKTTPLGVEQGGAFRALAESRRPEALKPLLDASRWGASPNESRHWAAMSIGTLAKFLEKADRERGVERLRDLLRDDDGRVRRMAVMGLRAANASEALDALESYGRGLSEQEQTGIKRTATAIRHAASAKPGGPDKQLDELRDTIRKLNERIEKLEKPSPQPS